MIGKNITMDVLDKFLRESAEDAFFDAMMKLPEKFDFDDETTDELTIIPTINSILL